MFIYLDESSWSVYIPCGVKLIYVLKYLNKHYPNTLDKWVLKPESDFSEEGGNNDQYDSMGGNDFSKYLIG